MFVIIFDMFIQVYKVYCDLIHLRDPLLSPSYLCLFPLLPSCIFVTHWV